MTLTTGRISLSALSLITSTGLVLPCSEPTTGSRLASQMLHREAFSLIIWMIIYGRDWTH